MFPAAPDSSPAEGAGADRCAGREGVRSESMGQSLAPNFTETDEEEE